jgi:hypothetical protein
MIDYFLHTDADYVGSLLQLFFCYSACLLVMMIYDTFTCKFPRCNGRCSASVDYSLPYTSSLLCRGDVDEHLLSVAKARAPDKDNDHFSSTMAMAAMAGSSARA